MVETNDGFVIAQRDLELRGPGDVLGKKQAGLPEFKLGDPISDFNILQVAQAEVFELLARPELLQKVEYVGIRQYLAEVTLSRPGLD